MVDRIFPPVSRTTDPVTSHAAEKRLDMQQRCRIADTLLIEIRRAGTKGLTAGEVSELVPYEYIQVWKRCSDLKRQRLVVAPGLQRYWAGSGRAQQVLVAIEFLRNARG